MRQNNNSVDCQIVACCTVLFYMGVPRHSFLIHTMDPSTLHCATPLRKIFALFLARENEREHVHKERNFPQAKLDSEMLVFF